MNTTQYIIVFVGILSGSGLGLLVGFFWFSKGRKVSDKVQSQINQKEQELNKVESKIAHAEEQIKTAEAEARATSKEILSEAKIQATEIEGKLEQGQARLEEKEKSLDEKVQEIDRQRTAVEAKNQEVEGLKGELTDAAEQHRSALKKVAKLSQEEAKEQLTKEVESEFSTFFAGQIKIKKKGFIMGKVRG